MEPVRMGYVGCGFMAQKVHIPNFHSLPNCELAAIAEVRTELGEKVRRRYGIPKLYRSHEELIADPTIDAIGVSATYVIQAEVARQAAAAGKAVFMEKPMAVSVKQADALLEACQKGGGRIMVGYMKRYDAGNELAHDVIRQWRQTGEMGDPVYARAHGFCGDWIAGLDIPMDTVDEPKPVPIPDEFLPDWLPRDQTDHYLGYLQQYTHNLNLLRFFLDAGDNVRVKTVDLNPDGYTGITVLDMNGVRATLETGSLRFYRWDEHTQVYFNRGWVHAWGRPPLQRSAVAEVEIYRNDEQGANGLPGSQHTLTRPIPEPRWSWAFKREAEHFVEQVRSGEPFRSSAQDTRTDVRLFEEIYRTWLQI